MMLKLEWLEKGILNICANVLITFCISVHNRKSPSGDHHGQPTDWRALSSWSIPEKDAVSEWASSTDKVLPVWICVYVSFYLSACLPVSACETSTHIYFIQTYFVSWLVIPKFAFIGIALSVPKLFPTFQAC